MDSRTVERCVTRTDGSNEEEAERENPDRRYDRLA